MPGPIATPDAEAQQDRRDPEPVQQHGIQDSPRQDGGCVTRQESERDANGTLDQRHGDGRLRVTCRTGDQKSGRHRHAAPGQPLAQPLARPGQPTPESHLREPELMRRCGVGQPLQVTEDDGRAEPLGQTIDLLVEDLPIGVVLRREITFGSSLGDEMLQGLPTQRAPLTAARHALCDPEQPARDRPAGADGPGPVGQDEEDGLKGILCIVRIVKDAPADTEHHRAVSDHQLLEGRLGGLVAPRDESVEELRIGHRPERSVVEQPVDLPLHPIGWVDRHFFRSPRLLVSSV
jgi:hypothetical protein